MTRPIPPDELKRQITREGKSWGVVPMELDDGRVLAAENIPVVFPGPGMLFLAEVTRDITTVDGDYPFSTLLRGRKKRDERTYSLRLELAQAKRNAAIQKRKDEIAQAIREDVKAMNRITIVPRIPVLR